MVANFLMHPFQKGRGCAPVRNIVPERSLYGINTPAKRFPHSMRGFEDENARMDAHGIGGDIKPIVTQMPARACSEKFHHRNSHKRHTTDSHHDIFE
jgi:hypothetical protein